MTNTMLFLVLLIAVCTTLIGRAAGLSFTAVRARRHAAWELDRAAWRRWMARP